MFFEEGQRVVVTTRGPFLHGTIMGVDASDTVDVMLDGRPGIIVCNVNVLIDERAWAVAIATRALDLGI